MPARWHGPAQFAGCLLAGCSLRISCDVKSVFESGAGGGGGGVNLKKKNVANSFYLYCLCLFKNIACLYNFYKKIFKGKHTEKEKSQILFVCIACLQSNTLCVCVCVCVYIYKNKI